MNHLACGSFNDAEEFIRCVADLRPTTAAFDCDDTLWFGDSGMKFFYWEIEQGLLPTEVAQAAIKRYDEYLAGRVSEDEMCGEMVQIHRGLKLHEVVSYAERFAKSNVISNYFPEMRRLVAKVQSQGCDIWAVSSTNSWVIEAAVREIGIPANRVLAARVLVENGTITDHLGEMTSGPGKALALKRVLDAPPDVAFGNSIFDLDMLALARHPFAVNPNPDLLRIAAEKGWQIYQPKIAKITSSTA
jgi:HAD superfamily hydrolase (TIGR01490 family)